MRLYLSILHQSDHRKWWHVTHHAKAPHSVQDRADQHITLRDQHHASNGFLRRTAHHRLATVSPQWSCKLLRRSIAWFSVTDLDNWPPQTQLKTDTRVHIADIDIAHRASSTTMLQIGVSILMSLQWVVERANLSNRIKSVSVWSDWSDGGTSCVCTHKNIWPEHHSQITTSAS